MYQGIRPYLTTGVVLAGASVIAVSPVTVPPPDVQAAALPAAQRVVEMSDVQLTSLAEDLGRFVEAVINAPRSAIWGVGQALDGLPDGLENAASAREAIGVLAEAFGNAYAAPIRAFLDPLIVNASPYNPAEQDFIDATLLAMRDLADDPLFLPTLPVTFVQLWGSLGFTPLQAVGVVAAGFLLKPFNLAAPFFAALANSLPAPLGGDLTSGDPEDWGSIYKAFDEAYIAVQDLILRVVLPDQIVANKVATKEVVHVDTWPPSVEEVGAAFETFGRQLEDVPEFLGTFAAEGTKAVVRYLAAGRPLDAIRLVAASAIALPLELSGPPVLLGAKLLPPPVGGLPGPGNDGGLLYGGFDEAFQLGSRILNRIAPDPLETKVVEQKQIQSSGPGVLPQNSGNVLNLKLPDLNVKQKIEDGGNLIGSQKADPLNGMLGTKTDDNRPKVGSNVRAVVKEVRQTVRQTVKDVRQGVRDVVKAVTGLGKKKDVKQEANENPAPPKPE